MERLLRESRKRFSRQLECVFHEGLPGSLERILHKRSKEFSGQLGHVLYEVTRIGGAPMSLAKAELVGRQPKIGNQHRPQLLANLRDKVRTLLNARHSRLYR